MLVLAMRMAAMFVLATSSIGRHARVLPTWFIGLGYVVGAFLLLAATLSAVLILVFPVWMLILCALLLVRARHIPRDATLAAARSSRSRRAEPWPGTVPSAMITTPERRLIQRCRAAGG